MSEKCGICGWEFEEKSYGLQCPECLRAFSKLQNEIDTLKSENKKLRDLTQQDKGSIMTSKKVISKDGKPVRSLNFIGLDAPEQLTMEEAISLKIDFKWEGHTLVYKDGKYTSPSCAGFVLSDEKAKSFGRCKVTPVEREV